MTIIVVAEGMHRASPPFKEINTKMVDFSLIGGWELECPFS